MKTLKFKGKKINKLYICVSKYFHNESFIDMEITFLLEIKNDTYIIKRDINDNWFPQISTLKMNEYNIIEYLDISELKNEKELDDIINFDIYDVSNDLLFESIVNSEILNTQYIYDKSTEVPFGIKFIFKNDFLISLPVVCGDNFCTKKFNTDLIDQYNNILFIDVDLLSLENKAIL